MNGVFYKSEQGVLDYSIDWTEWLEGDTIVASTWNVATGITKDSDTFSPSTATIFVSGGTKGKRYKLENIITTASNPARVKKAIIYIVISDVAIVNNNC